MIFLLLILKGAQALKYALPIPALSLAIISCRKSCCHIGMEPFNSQFQLVLCIGQLNKLCCCYAIGLSN